MDTERNYKEILEYLENCYTGARAMGDEDIQLRVSRAIGAFKADIDEDIFTPEYHKKYIEMEVGAYEMP